MISCIFALLIVLTVTEVVEDIQNYQKYNALSPKNFPGSRFRVKFFPFSRDHESTGKLETLVATLNYHRITIELNC